MKFSLISTLVVALAAENAVASTWLGTKSAYNKWHETELERWLSDHNIPYPTPADRKDLENLVKDNWNALVSQVQGVWTETEDSVNTAYGSTRDWIFDSWTDSQLKSFLDKHGVPNPQPRTRDTLLKSARENYQSIANKISETHIAYPGDWLYDSWSESDLKSWLDERGYPAPQPSSRDKLIAQVRRNSRLASLQAQDAYSSLSASAAAATNYLSDSLLESWSDSQIKEWADKNGIKVPQGSKRNELIALARKNREKIYASGSSAASSASSYLGAATTSAGNQYAQATEDASLKGQQVYGAFGYYLDMIKQRLGLGEPSYGNQWSSLTGAGWASASSASSVLNSYGSQLSSLTGSAWSSASSASSVASVSASSASSAASRSAESASRTASLEASKSSKSASSSASSASSKAKQEL